VINLSRFWEQVSRDNIGDGAELYGGCAYDSHQQFGREKAMRRIKLSLRNQRKVTGVQPDEQEKGAALRTAKVAITA
jgi:hypothetical protein